LFKLRTGDNGSSPSGIYVLAAILFAAVNLAILVLAYFERPVESSIALLTVGTGIPFYLAFAKTARHRTAAHTEG
jgi:APA family basic amino acid/polyamine antiporter